MKTHTRPPDNIPWAQHLVSPAADGGSAPWQPVLSPAEAARVQRHQDRLMAALQAHDRVALLRAKQEVLADVYRPGSACDAAAATPSTALRGALRDLSWRMAGLLLPRCSHH
ncbi:MAG: hypothetical protein ACK41V_10375 [Acidovorax sp.]|uniref:hypothetical protein n=1 Tax=Acidovorax sp. TaxID=1872122 RepID=UPI003918F78F